MKKIIIIYLFIIIFNSCQKQDKSIGKAIKSLEEFILISSNLKNYNDRFKLTPFLSNQMANEIKNMNEPTFKDKFLNHQIQLKKLEIVDYHDKPDGFLSIMYDINFERITNDNKISIESEKIVELVYKEKSWKIDAFYDLSTSMVFSDGFQKLKKGDIF